MTESTLLTSAQAAARLGVKASTLYAYVSRGLLARTIAPDGRTSLFDAADLARLSRRGGARRAPSDVAVASELSLIAPGVLAYRGVDVLRACAELRFEEIAWWLWTGSFEGMGPWQAGARSLRAAARVRAAPAVDRPALVASALATARPGDFGTRAGTDVMACLAPAAGTRYAARIGAIPPRMVRVVDAAMSLACEQGLTCAALAARLATASGAGIAGAVAAAAHVAVPRARTTAAIGEALAGGTPLRGAALELASSKATYKDGDPRAAVLMQLFEEASPAQAAAVARAAPDDMTLEYVVAGVGWAYRISSGALLAIAQAAGWIAHALEERRNPTPYRPRLAYTGPPLRATTPRRTLDAVQQYLARQ